MVLGSGQANKEEALLFRMVAVFAHGKMRKRRWRREPEALPLAWHVARGDSRKMNRSKFQSFASVNSHHPHGVHIACLRGHCPVGSVFIQKLDAPDALQGKIA